MTGYVGGKKIDDMARLDLLKTALVPMNGPLREKTTKNLFSGFSMEFCYENKLLLC